MCYYWDYTTGRTTDPNFIAVLINVLRERISARIAISIVESDASAMKCKHGFKFLGYEKLARDYDVNLVNLSEDDSELIRVTVEGRPFDLEVPCTIQNSDLRINVPKIKYSLESIKFAGALKNIFGCIPYPEKYRYHKQIHDIIVALNKAMKFNICLVDGNIVSGIRPRRLRLVMAARDAVATDVVGSKIVGIDPATIRYLQLAYREGLGEISFVTKGIPLDYFKERYPGRNAHEKIMSKAYHVASSLGFSRILRSI